MSARLRERRSLLAVWSSRLSLLSIPILVIVAIGHRSDLMTATQAYAVMALGFALAGFGVLAALGALEGIWRDGRKGLGPALRGLLVGLAVLIVPVAGAWKLVTYPQLIDISTDVDDPPAFVLAAADRPADARPVTDPSDDDIELQREAYPDIVSRHYPVGTVRVFEDAKTIVGGRNWRVLGMQPPTDEEAVALRCPNVDCPARLSARLEHFASRGALDIDGCGPKRIEQLLDLEHPVSADEGEPRKRP